MDNEERDNTLDKPWLFKKGNTIGRAGRPKGKSLKEYSREYLASMTDEERQDFLDGITKETVWKMAEGNPESKSEVKVEGDKIISTGELLNLAKELNELTRNNAREGIGSNGTSTDTLDTEIQD